MQKAKEAATETKTERARAFWFVCNRSVVEFEFFQTVAQVFKVIAVDGVQTTKHHWLRVVITRQWFFSRFTRTSNCFTASCFTNVFNAGNEIAHFTGAKFGNRSRNWAAHTNFNCFVNGTCVHEQQFAFGVERALHDANAAHYSAVLVVLTIEDECLEWQRWVARWRRNALHDGIEQIGNAFTCFC